MSRKPRHRKSKACQAKTDAKKWARYKLRTRYKRMVETVMRVPHLDSGARFATPALGTYSESAHHWEPRRKEDIAMAFYRWHGKENRLVEVRGGPNICNSTYGEDGVFQDNGHKGLFAKQDITADTRLCPYVGELHHRGARWFTAMDSRYRLRMDADTTVDALDYHYDVGYMLGRGMARLATRQACAPNYARYANTINPGNPTETDKYVFNSRFIAEEHGHDEVWLHSTTDIPAGTEILVDYGDEYVL